MTSQYWDEAQAAAYREFRYEFPERALGGKAIIVAGGSGGLGAATVALLAREGAQLVVGYRTNRERAEALRRSIEENFHCTISPGGGRHCRAQKCAARIWQPPRRPARRSPEPPSSRAIPRASLSRT